MSDTASLMTEMTGRLLAEQFDDAAIRAAREGVWPEAAWRAAADQGLPLALVEGEQGFGVALSDGLELVRLLGKRAAPLPLAETMIANCLLARTGLAVRDGVVALVPEGSGLCLNRSGAGWGVTGTAERVAWGRHADALLVEAEGRLALVTSGIRLVEPGENLARMPRDTIGVDAAAEVVPVPGVSLLEAGALVRSLAMAGALETLLSLTLDHVTQRVQFGRPISQFQAVQHALARVAAEVAAGSAAADGAAGAFAASMRQSGVALAAARIRLSDAVGTANGIAHQLHGAMGFTGEHRLHWFTTALWSWRDEFGSATWWTRRLGAAALENTGDSYWPFITSV